jgi:hypothetical protein
MGGVGLWSWVGWWGGVVGDVGVIGWGWTVEWRGGGGEGELLSVQ